MDYKRFFSWDFGPGSCVLMLMPADISIYTADRIDDYITKCWCYSFDHGAVDIYNAPLYHERNIKQLKQDLKRYGL